MSNNSELEVLFHAFNLDNGFSSTKISRLFKSYKEEGDEMDRDALLNIIGVPSNKAWEMAREEISQARDIGIQVINFLHQDYPKHLFEISDPPLVLFISSKKDLTQSKWNQSKIWAVVGARDPSRYGMKIAQDLGEEFVLNNITVVSGLAYGIDRAAHDGAIRGYYRGQSIDCPTIAVLGSGLLEIYPSEHRSFAKEVVESGGILVTEYGLKKKPRAFLFPRRNRIISGLSYGIVVVEARRKSGSLITARLAMEQGREVFCIPGPIDSPLSEGVNNLIKEGAGIVSSVEDLVKNYSSNLSMQKSSLRSSLELIINKNISESQQRLLSELQEIDLSFDELLETGHFEEPLLRRDLLQLEIRGFLVSERGLYCMRR